MRTIRNVLAGALVALVGCAGSGAGDDALASIGHRGRAVGTRVRAIEEVGRESVGDESRHQAWAYTVEQVAWNTLEVPPVRAAAIRALVGDSDAVVAERAKERAREALRMEPSREVVLTICREASSRGWVDFVPAIVRSYSRRVMMVPNEEDRAERAALAALCPGESPEAVAFRLFVQEGASARGRSGGTSRLRLDAWELLARLDPTGEQRLAMLDTTPASDPLLERIALARRDLRAIPLTPAELAWLESLRDPANAENAAWWGAAAAAIASLPADERLSLRHAEVIRHTARGHPERLGAPRESLVAEVRARLSGREHFERVGDPPSMRPRESLDAVGPRLSRADLLAVLAVDDAVQAPGVPDIIWAQALMDRKDATTEYGGLVRLTERGPEFVLYPPRPGERQGDNKFIASPDLILRSDTALAHYHLHAQTQRNHDVAGPSAGDLEYAARFGRTCVVFTTLGNGVLDVDYYQPGGAVIDLGTIRAGGVR
jgi:hypothetical protein